MFTEQGNGLNKGVGVLDSEPAPELRTTQDVTEFAEQVIGDNKTNPTGNGGFEEVPRCSLDRQGGRNEDAGVDDIPGPNVRAPWRLRCYDARGDPCGWPRASSSSSYAIARASCSVRSVDPD